MVNVAANCLLALREPDGGSDEDQALAYVGAELIAAALHDIKQLRKAWEK
jgi:hypothetical protein